MIRCLYNISISTSIMAQVVSQGKEVTISVQSLLKLSQGANQAGGPLAYMFSYEWQKKEQLKALDTKQIPNLPLRRVGCLTCISKKINDCSKCQDCKSKPCCRNIICIFDYHKWINDKQNPIYRFCACSKSKEPNLSGFEIDWRLANLIEKIGNKDSNNKFNLYFKSGKLWIAEQDDPSSKPHRNQCYKIYNEDNFGQFFFHQKQIKDINSVGNNLTQSNSHHFTNLLKVNIKRFLTAKDSWEVSNLQEECQEIAETFYANRKMELIKGQFQSPDNIYSNMPSLKYQGKYTQSYTSSKAKNQSKNNYSGCSQYFNEHILFYYCAKSQMIFVRNAKYYEQDQEYSNIRGIKVTFTGNGNFDRAVWFKDRKGDIFAFNGNTLSIFRYHINDKAFKQFQLETHQIFSTVNNSSALLYIHQKDAVYYFNANDFKRSFFFTLYRPKNSEENKLKKDQLSKLSCTSINLSTDTFYERQKSVRSGGFCRVTYIMQDYRFRKGKEQRRQLIPAIYLFIQRKNYLPLNVGVHKIVHTEELLNITEIPSNSLLNSPNNQSNKMVNFQAGVLFTLRFQKSQRFYFYTMLDHKSTLLNAKIINNDDKYSVLWTDEFVEFNGCSGLKAEPSKRLEGKGKILNHMICGSEIAQDSKKFGSYKTIQINDNPGIASNNEIRMLGKVLDSDKIVQFYLTTVQGTPEWHIYDLD